MGLGLLGGVVFAVLLEVAPLASGLDASRDLGASTALQLVQFLAQPLKLTGCHFDCVHARLLPFQGTALPAARIRR